MRFPRPPPPLSCTLLRLRGRVLVCIPGLTMIRWSTRYTAHFIKWMTGVPRALLLVPDRDSKPSNTVTFIMQSFFACLDQDAQVGGFQPQPGTSTRPVSRAHSLPRVGPWNRGGRFLFRSARERIPVTGASLLRPLVCGDFPRAVCCTQFITALRLIASNTTLFKRPNL